MSERHGGCMCGAVRFVARDVPADYGACHCEMCRRWTGSALLGVTVPEGNLSWEGAENIATIQSSSWAERAFCAKCGSGLYFRVTLESEYSGALELPIGLFDELDGFRMTSEIYIDHKPDAYAYAGAGRKLMTRADCVAKFSALNGE
jgi:hypothetical protein